MMYAHTHTSVPVPKVHGVHTTPDGYIYIEMDYIKGDTLSASWRHLSPDQRETIFAQLKQHLCALRALPPPSAGVVSSAWSNPAYDGRIGQQFFGPATVAEFHSQARGHLVEEDLHYIGDEVVRVHGSDYKTVFTHGDLAMRNILVRDGSVAGIIDWAYAGWYPEYWEFTKAHYAVLGAWDDWKHYIRKALAPYEAELEAERILWERIPEPGTATTAYRDGVTHTNPGSFPSAAWLAAREGMKRPDLWSVALDRLDRDMGRVSDS